MRSLALALLSLLLALTVRAQPAAPRTAHVYVALCDNEHQGIVPVPRHLGRGDDLRGNLFWGAAYGVSTYFRRSADWTLVQEVRDPRPGVLQRLLFRHRRQDVALLADAYRGDRIRAAIEDFLAASAGAAPETVSVPGHSLRAGGAADLLAFVGHDGLMDFQVDPPPAPRDGRRRQAIVLACASRTFFADALRRTGAAPLLWTTGLLAPEAYVLHDSLGAWVEGQGGAEVRERAATAYDRHQKCGLKAARRLFATGW